MRTRPSYPTLLEINTRVWLSALGRASDRTATLDDVPDEALNRLADQGMDWVWLLGVWECSQASRQMAMDQWHAPSPPLHATALQTQAQAPASNQSEFHALLPDLRDQDIGGSCFAVTGYTVPPQLGGAGALARLRQRLRQRGIRLMLDFIPNHVALDHPWALDHPDYFVSGTEADLARAPQAYCRFVSQSKDRILAYGRDPNFPPWSDTLQLNYGQSRVVKAMQDQLDGVANLCDGVRCDMAMLILPEVFENHWGIRAQPFWPETISRVRQRHPEFTFMAEVYWNLEHRLQQEGFDYAYDKTLYDRLRWHDAQAVKAHLSANLEFQSRLARFLENHDESRAAAAFPQPKHQAAALVAYLSPGLRLFHQGQFEGYTKRVPVQLARAPEEVAHPGLKTFYDRLLHLLQTPALRQGLWRWLECAPAQEGIDNGTWRDLLAWQWESDRGRPWLVIVNFAPHASQGRVRLPWPGLESKRVILRDALGSAPLEREGTDLAAHGLFLDLAPWESRVFEGC